MQSAGTAVRDAREAQQLSLSKLSRLAGVSVAHLSRVERGHRQPSPQWLHQVTRALGHNLATGGRP